MSSNIQNLKAMGAADKYRALVKGTQSRFQRPDGSVCLSPADFSRTVQEAARIAVIGQRDVQTLFAYSSVCWDLTIAASTTLLANDAATRKFFSYGVDDQNNVVQLGGFPAAYQARYDDTNLTKGGKPPFGPMLIERIGVFFRVTHQHRTTTGVANAADPIFNGILMGNISLAIGTNGSRKLKHLGSPVFWAGHGGLSGGATDSVGTAQNYQTIGLGAGQRFERQLDEPLVWQASGGVDDDLVLQVDVEHDVVLPYTVAEGPYPQVRCCLWALVEGRSVEQLSANG